MKCPYCGERFRLPVRSILSKEEILALHVKTHHPEKWNKVKDRPIDELLRG